MNFLLGIFSLFLLHPDSDSIIGKYYHSVQHCHISHVTDYQWKLELLPSNRFELTVMIYRSLTKTRDFNITVGTWKIENGDLFLKSVTATKPLNDLNKEVAYTFDPTQKSYKRITRQGMDDFPSYLSSEKPSSFYPLDK